MKPFINVVVIGIKTHRCSCSEFVSVFNEVRMVSIDAYCPGDASVDNKLNHRYDASALLVAYPELTASDHLGYTTFSPVRWS